MTQILTIRAWNKEWGMLLPVEEIKFEDGKPVSISVTVEVDYLHINEWEDYEIGKDIEVMQYTGLKDKSGTEIYEGDITEQGIITFSRGKFTGTYYDSNGNLEEDWEDDLYQRPDIEIIGNIYENPELLNK